MPVNVTQETANLIDTLANAASKIGSTKASARLNEVIVELLPSEAEQAELTELKARNAEVEKKFDDTMIAVDNIQEKLSEIIGLFDESPIAANEKLNALKAEVDAFITEIDAR